MRRCLETACRVVLKCSARALGVMACRAISAMMALRVGSAIAWKMSLLILPLFLIMKPISCKYIRNQSVSQVFLKKIWGLKFGDDLSCTTSGTLAGAGRLKRLGVGKVEVSCKGWNKLAIGKSNTRIVELFGRSPPGGGSRAALIRRGR